jgi:hypothetical protein
METPTMPLTHNGLTVGPDAIRIAQTLARKIFAARGNHSEVHLREVTLVAMLAVAAQTGMTPPTGT